MHRSLENKIFATGDVDINNLADFYRGYKMQNSLSIINRKQMNSNGGNWQYHFIINLLCSRFHE